MKFNGWASDLGGATRTGRWMLRPGSGDCQVEEASCLDSSACAIYTCGTCPVEEQTVPIQPPQESPGDQERDRQNDF